MKSMKNSNENHTVGRPRFIEDGKYCQVYLDRKSLEIAKKLGNGNISLGIRTALLNSACHVDETPEHS